MIKNTILITLKNKTMVDIQCSNPVLCILRYRKNSVRDCLLRNFWNGNDYFTASFYIRDIVCAINK